MELVFEPVGFACGFCTIVLISQNFECCVILESNWVCACCNLLYFFLYGK